MSTAEPEEPNRRPLRVARLARETIAVHAETPATRHPGNLPSTTLSRPPRPGARPPRGGGQADGYTRGGAPPRPRVGGAPGAEGGPPPDDHGRRGGEHPRGAHRPPAAHEPRGRPAHLQSLGLRVRGPGSAGGRSPRARGRRLRLGRQHEGGPPRRPRGRAGGAADPEGPGGPHHPDPRARRPAHRRPLRGGRTLRRARGAVRPPGPARALHPRGRHRERGARPDGAGRDHPPPDGDAEPDRKGARGPRPDAGPRRGPQGHRGEARPARCLPRRGGGGGVPGALGGAGRSTSPGARTSATGPR